MTSKSETGQKTPLLNDIETKKLTPSVDRASIRCVNLRDLGFVGYVSDAALDAIDRNEVRASLVLTTSTKFAFR